MTVRVKQTDTKETVPLATIDKGEGFLAAESRRLYIRVGSMVGNHCRCTRLMPSRSDYTLEGSMQVYPVNLTIHWELA